MAHKFSDDDLALLAAYLWCKLHERCRETCIFPGAEGGFCADDNIRLAFVSGMTHGRIATFADLLPWIQQYWAAPQAERDRLTAAIENAGQR
jgi:hypothetical protein